MSGAEGGGGGSCFLRRLPTTSPPSAPSTTTAMTTARMTVSITPPVSAMGPMNPACVFFPKGRDRLPRPGRGRSRNRPGPGTGRSGRTSGCLTGRQLRSWSIRFRPLAPASRPPREGGLPMPVTVVRFNLVEPYSDPHPLLLVGGSSKAAARRAARLGLPFFPSAHLPELEAYYKERLVEYGTEGWTMMPAAETPCCTSPRTRTGRGRRTASTSCTRRGPTPPGGPATSARPCDRRPRRWTNCARKASTGSSHPTSA